MDGNDEQGWGVFDPIGDLLIIYQDKTDAEAHAAEHNRRFGYPPSDDAATSPGDLD